MSTAQTIPTDSTGRESAELAAPLSRFPRSRHIETVRRLSRVSGARTILLLLGVWVPLVAAMAWAINMPRWWVFLIAGCVVASRQVAMGVLVHDAVHYSLFKNKLLNDVVSDVFLAFPIGMSTGLYRRTHLIHHRHTGTDQDIDLAAQREEQEWFEWPKTKSGLVWTLVRSLLGLNFYRGFVMFKHWSPALHLRDPLSPYFPLSTRVLYLVNIVLVYAAFGLGFAYAPRATLTVALVYMIPGLTIVNLAMRIRATAEHIGTAGGEELRATRTVLPHWWERPFISPVGVNYHLEHHLFPSVPGPRLAELHKELMTDQEYREHAHLTHGYDGVVRELMTAAE